MIEALAIKKSCFVRLSECGTKKKMGFSRDNILKEKAHYVAAQETGESSMENEWNETVQSTLELSFVVLHHSHTCFFPLSRTGNAHIQRRIAQTFAGSQCELEKDRFFEYSPPRSRSIVGQETLSNQ